MKYTIGNFLMMVTLATAFLSCSTNDQKATNQNITKASIKETDEGYRIFLDNEPFFIKGAGVERGSIDALAKHGANAVRTWGTEDAQKVLDNAQKYGLKVMMGLRIGIERHGFDYNDEEKVKEQLAQVKSKVMKYKDHPALIMWGIGNELNHEYTNPKVWDAVNDISKMIHEVDPHHLTTTPLAGLNSKEVEWIETKATDLDFLSVQLYGPMDFLPQIIDESTYTGPLIVTEWGATGWWEVAKTEWNAPIENNSSVKADLYLSRYQNSIMTQTNQIMGSFVFLWGQKQERTPTWFGMFMPDGNETESIDAMHFAWNESWPENRSPRLVDFTLDGKKATDNIKLNQELAYNSEVIVTDPDNDKLQYRWEVMEESQSKKTGGDKEYIPDVVDGIFVNDSTENASFKCPKDPGAYRLFIYVNDGNGHTAHANIPFLVE